MYNLYVKKWELCMGLTEELGLKKPFTHQAHEAVLNIVLTGTELVKEGTHTLKPVGLTDAQFNVLMLLSEHSDGRRLNQTELGRMLLVNRSNITGLVDRMERDGLVSRRPDPDDRRINWIEMTDRGREVLSTAHEAYYRRIEDVMSGLPAEDCRTLCRLLEEVRRGLRSTSVK